MRLTKQSVTLLYLSSCTIFANLLFLYGFFSFGYNDSRTSMPNDIPSTIRPNQNDSEPWRFDTRRLYHKSVNKVVLMVIDGIRYDFFTESEYNVNMPFTTDLIKQNRSCLFRTRVNAPTVTMPRIKALTTGTVPNFIDLVLNLDSSAVQQDSIIYQARAANKQVIFYGDETWLKLFPNSFVRHDGTTSFYISDYTEVDNNVTRHLENELKPTADWDIMILHYLGLDHIGHTGGPRSKLMPNKLSEMDNIIRRIVNYMDSEKSELPSVLIVCGDHGMRDNGGHGGSSTGEVVVPLFVYFKNKKCGGYIKEEIMQTDFVPSISVIMGLPIPSSSTGKLINKILQNLNINEILFAYHYNSQQMYTNYISKKGLLNKAFMKDYDNAILYYYDWLKRETISINQAHSVISLYESALSGMSNYIIGSIAKFDVFLIIVSIVLSIQVWLLLVDFDAVNIQFIKVSRLVYLMLIRWAVCVWLQCDSVLCEFTATFNLLASVIITMFIINLGSFGWPISSLIRLEISDFNNNNLFYVLPGSFIHVLSLFSSSYIEEEHQLLYHLWAGFSALQVYKTFILHSYTTTAKWILSMILHRICKNLNTIGNQSSGVYSLGDWFRESQNQIYLTILMVVGLCCIFYASINIHRVIKNNKRFNILSAIIFVLYFWTLCSVYMYRVETKEVAVPYGYNILKLTFSLHSWTIAWYLLIGCHTFLVIKQTNRNNNKFNSAVCSIIILLILRLSLLLRPHNILVPAVLVYTCKLLQFKIWNTLTTTTLHYWLSLMFFFYQGNSNSVGTLDIVPGYIGQTSYNPVVAGIHIFTHTYGLPILVYLFLVLDQKFSGLQTLCMLNVTQSCVYNLVILLFRNHLFIWSVFSPKLLYIVMFTSTTYVFSALIIILLTLCGTSTKKELEI
ncbi:GPI ethanolamine phosphate transferase 2 isoform X1 [Acyrthosiphon pisum]|uniref:GPI ethanolamine phosphate transferase 2 C-terminal domain-containing protein n=1 Tax=Acyrthosiphon pisum TaxID=7029 RepID=A0A8R2A713_ACYPI|nr:GPI ethanolamine phosphate transferase 2 isoform X1 [Acyrthosiphon pisum]|eukprot:XP_001947092.2 PREDICTED: GPI ethanolamine phosphate transferase 2 isoform X1 [Acyrthosiphon pisum]